VATAPADEAEGVRPAVVPCAGETALARLSRDVAAGLVQAGLAGRAGPGDGRPLVALDGCPSACATRSLLARDAAPVLSIGLHRLGGPDSDRRRLVERTSALVVRLLLEPGQAPTARRRSAAVAPRAAGSGRSHSTLDYLWALHLLEHPVVSCGALLQDAPILAADVARLLGVSRASAGEKLGRLEADGLVARGSRREVRPTAAGRAAAARVVRRHRVFERFLADFLGYSAATSLAGAALVRGSFTDAAVERIAERLGSPERCPHGWPLDPLLESRDAAGLVALTGLDAGECATVAALWEGDADAVARAEQLGLLPGAAVVAGEVDERLAAAVLVRRARR
jgi:DtxR family Mn-dependent transcriptional regulator